MTNDRNTSKKLISIRLDPALVKEIQHLAIDLDRTVTSIFEEAAREFLDRYKKTPRP